MEDEMLCDCGECRYCLAHMMSEYDTDEPCPCGGAGCHNCEVVVVKSDKTYILVPVPTVRRKDESNMQEQ